MIQKSLRIESLLRIDLENLVHKVHEQTVADHDIVRPQRSVYSLIPLVHIVLRPTKHVGLLQLDPNLPTFSNFIWYFFPKLIFHIVYLIYNILLFFLQVLGHLYAYIYWSIRFDDIILDITLSKSNSSKASQEINHLQTNLVEPFQIQGPFGHFFGDFGAQSFLNQGQVMVTFVRREAKPAFV